MYPRKPDSCHNSCLQNVSTQRNSKALLPRQKPCMGHVRVPQKNALRLKLPRVWLRGSPGAQPELASDGLGGRKAPGRRPGKPRPREASQLRRLSWLGRGLSQGASSLWKLFSLTLQCNFCLGLLCNYARLEPQIKELHEISCLQPQRRLGEKR